MTSRVAAVETFVASYPVVGQFKFFPAKDGKPPARKDGVKKLTAGREQSIPIALDPARWYSLVVEIVGGEMRVSLDGKAVGYLKSSGLAHPMKREFCFAVSGQNALFDDVRIWGAAKAE